MESKIIAEFEKVSFEQFLKDFRDCFWDTDETYKNYTDSQVRLIYNEIKLPKRATKGSAGYDFFMPFLFTFNEKAKKIPTGIRCNIEPGYVLMLYPRSGLGFKYGARLKNSTGVIDQDYFYANNEGHIMAKILSDKEFLLGPQESFMQGIFMPYYLAKEEEVTTERTGGFGSTSRK